MISGLGSDELPWCFHFLFMGDVDLNGNTKGSYSWNEPYPTYSINVKKTHCRAFL